MMSGAQAQIAPAAANGQEVMDKKPIVKPGLIARRLAKSFDPAFLQNRKVAIGNRQHEAGHTRGVQFAILAADTSSTASSVVAPCAVVLGTGRIVDLRIDQIVS